MSVDHRSNAGRKVTLVQPKLEEEKIRLTHAMHSRSSNAAPLMMVPFLAHREKNHWDGLTPYLAAQVIILFRISHDQRFFTSADKTPPWIQNDSLTTPRWKKRCRGSRMTARLFLGG
jgi:hypothetical protein